MPLPKWELASGDRAVCTRCGAANMVRVFPAALAPSAPARPEAALEGEAACFDHPSKRAVAHCQQCGRFVCQLCAVEVAGEISCPSCVAAGAGKARAANPETSRTLYDSIALLLPLVSLLLWPLTIVAAPAAVLLAVATWRRPISLVRRSRWRFVLAVVLGFAFIAAWVWFFAYLVAGIKRGRV